MKIPYLLADLVAFQARLTPEAVALVDGPNHVSYAALWQQIEHGASGLSPLMEQRDERVAVYLEKRIEAVVSAFAATHAGGVFVPINPVLKAAQVGHILRDCGVSILVTSTDRLHLLAAELVACPGVRHVVVVDAGEHSDWPALSAHCLPWSNLLKTTDLARSSPRVDADMAAIFYTSGSTGKPKGVVLSHRNLITGARSVNHYLENSPDDILLGVLPLSFDAGFSQLTTGFAAGSRVVLLNYLMPRDVLLAMQREHVSGLTAVPPLYIQLARLDWPEHCTRNLRYFANTGGRMPRDTLQRLRDKAPRAKPFLMYGLTEAFRSTFLPPAQVDSRPDSIGKAIPNTEILVLRPDGSSCQPGEAGELVHRGALVALGYWNNPEATAERFKPLPNGIQANGLMLPEIAVFSGDSVRTDEEGYLYFVGRRDEMIKTSGYRVSPTEIEEALYATGEIAECVAFGVAHAVLGQSIHVIATLAPGSTAHGESLLAHCRERLPAYMVPATIELISGSLPRNSNGKFDRLALGTTAPSKQIANSTENK